MNQFTVTATYAGSTATQSWTVTPTGTVRGTTAETCFSDSGQSMTAFLERNERGDTVQILVPNSAGSFDTHSTTVAQDGTFSVPNIPAGSFWLMSLWTTLWTSSSSINLGSNYWGGCHEESVSSVGTELQVTANGLIPWQPTDYFDFLVPNERLGVPDVPLPATGATSVSETDDYANLLLLNSANGDNAYAFQLVTATYAGIPFQVLQGFGGPLPITIENGVVNSVSTTLQSEPQTNSIRVTISGSAFTALHSSMSRGATEVMNPGDNFRVEITADNIGPSSIGMFLVLASHSFSADTDAGNIAFANPYPTAWTPYVHYYDSAVQNLLAPGASSPIPVPVFNEVVTAEFPTASNPMVPLVGPALNPQINGVGLLQDQVISGTTPTLTWQPPALGTAYIYYIQVLQFAVTNGSTSLMNKGQLTTTNTSLVLPQGFLASGNSYCILIESVYRNTPGGPLAPYQETFPEGTSELASGVITVL